MWGKSLQTLPGVPLAPAPRNGDPCLLSLTLQACAAIVVLQWMRMIYSWPEHHDHRGLQHSLPSPQFRELSKSSLPPPPGSFPRDGESPLLLSLTFLDGSQPCQRKHSAMCYVASSLYIVPPPSVCVTGLLGDCEPGAESKVPPRHRTQPAPGANESPLA